MRRRDEGLGAAGGAGVRTRCGLVPWIHGKAQRHTSTGHREPPPPFVNPPRVNQIPAINPELAAMEVALSPRIETAGSFRPVLREPVIYFSLLAPISTPMKSAVSGKRVLRYCPPSSHPGFLPSTISPRHQWAVDPGFALAGPGLGGKRYFLTTPPRKCLRLSRYHSTRTFYDFRRVT